MTAHSKDAESLGGVKFPEMIYSVKAHSSYLLAIISINKINKMPLAIGDSNYRSY